jgi:hypothetical protein
VACLCHERHAYLETHNAEEARFFEALLGDTRYKPWERAEMAAHYRAQMKHIERRRLENGEEGFIDVVPWD